MIMLYKKDLLEYLRILKRDYMRQSLHYYRAKNKKLGVMYNHYANCISILIKELRHS